MALLDEPAVAERWDEPSSLPSMTVGALAGHLCQMITALAGWLDGEEPDASAVEVRSVVDVYGRTARLHPGEGLDGKAASTIRKWAAQAGADGPAAAAERTGATARLPDLLAAVGPDRLVPSTLVRDMAMRLGDYLRTRCVEFVVHVDDLALSAGLPAPEPDPTAAVAVDLLVELCRARAGDAELLRALARPGRVDPDVLRAL